MTFLKQVAVYVIQNTSGQIYVGLSRKPHKRIKQHRSGKCITTGKYLERDFEFVHIWWTPSYLQASKLEGYLHRLQRKSDSHVIDVVLDCPLWGKYLHAESSKIPTTALEAWQGYRLRIKR